jgi:hypothetical protein
MQKYVMREPEKVQLRHGQRAAAMKWRTGKAAKKREGPLLPSMQKSGVCTDPQIQE